MYTAPTPRSVNSLAVGGAKRFKTSGLATGTARLFTDRGVQPDDRINKKQIKKLILTFFGLDDGFSRFPAGSRQDF